MQLLRKPIIIILVSSLIINSCKKIDFFNIKSDVDIQTKFFSSHRSYNNDENKLIAFLEKRNLEENFIPQTVRQIGFPRWNKLIKRTVYKSNVNEISSNSLENRIILKSSESNSNIYYIPFVRDSQNHVNSSMIIETTPTDTTLSYVCDWQYKKIPPNQNNREKFAVFFMNFDRNVFGHNKFEIKDQGLFKQSNKVASILEFKEKNLSAKDMYNINYCEEVQIKWYECPYTRCNGEYGTCDRCPEACTKSIDLTFCWTEWYFIGDGGSVGGGGSFDPGSVGVGGGGNSSAPPNPCSSNTDPDFGSSTYGSNPYNDPNCNSESGWSPVTGRVPPALTNPCENLKNLAKQIDTLFNKSKIDSSLNTIQNLSTETLEKGFPIFVNFSVNPFDVHDTAFSYTQGDIQTGTASSINITSNTTNLKKLVATLHTHPSIGFPAPSPKDIYTLIKENIDNKYYKTSFIKASNGEQFSIIISDITKANAFFSTMAQNLDSEHWKEDSDIGKAFEKAKDFYEHNYPNKRNYAYEMAMAAVLKQYDVGVTLNKKDANGNFKPLVVNTLVIPKKGLLKPEKTLYTSDCQ